MWINDVETVRAIVNAISDEYSRKIIAATVPKSKSPEEISEEQGIPVSTCYRRIHDLLTLSIIQVSRIDLANGKKSVLYQSVYKNILVKFESNELSVDLVPNVNSPSDNLSGMWKIMQRESQNASTSPTIVIQDCDLCQSSDANYKVFVTGDSKSYLSICGDCEKKMRERSTIRAVETVAQERIAHSLLNRSKRD
ncbi:MAG: winged helix-turn-helix domain-containing protein [archaeon]|nr:winged helix-turn-helix domain-containing protein [archaeon]